MNLIFNKINKRIIQIKNDRLIDEYSRNILLREYSLYLNNPNCIDLDFHRWIIKNQWQPSENCTWVKYEIIYSDQELINLYMNQ